MSVSQVNPLTSGTTAPPSIFSQAPPTKGFSTGSCFSWLHEINVKFSTNVRGQVNHDYNRKLQEQGLATHSIPGGENFHELGMDTTTSIVRPDLYFEACQKVMSGLTNTPFSGLTLSTANFFDLLHQENVNNRVNIRGLINQKYNQLLFEAGICAGRISGDNLEQLGMDKGTPLNRVDLYLKAYEAVIANFKAPALSSNCGPFENLHPDVFLNMTQFMSPDDIFKCTKVSKYWDFLSNNRLIWKPFFEERKIPFVESVKGQNYGLEFLLFRKVMPFGGREIEGLFGPFGDIPDISRVRFEQLFQKDPFEPEKFMWETFQFVVIPDAFKRTSCWKTFPFTVNTNGDLVKALKESECTGQTLLIPNKIGNLKILCKRPLAGKENMPVFSYFSDGVLKQCNTCPNKVSLVFMRTCIVGRNMAYPAQESFVKKLGFGVLSLRERLFFNAVCILISGTCPDATEPRYSYALTSDGVVVGSNVYQAGIGGFAPGSGADVLSHSYVNVRVGVVPGGPAEVLRPLVLGTLALDKGH